MYDLNIGLMLKTVEDLLVKLQFEGIKERQKFEDITHGPTIGDMYEGLTQELLKKAIFKDLNLFVSKGLIQGYDGKYSDEIDCMLTIGEGKQIPDTDRFIHQIKNVIMIIEVKKTLNRRKIKDAFNNHMSVIDLVREDYKINSEKYENDFRAKILEDSFRPFFGIKNYDTVEFSSLGYLYYSLMAEQVLPLRIIYSYGNYKTMNGFRNAVKHYLINSKISALDAASYFPNLIVCGDKSIIKYNGQPFYDKPKSENDIWLLAASQKGNPIYNFLNILWYHLCKRFNKPFEFFSDGRIYTFHKFISCGYKDVKGKPQPVFYYSIYPKGAVEALAMEIPWEPLKVKTSVYVMLLYIILSKKDFFEVFDEDGFINWIKNEVDKYKTHMSWTSLLPEWSNHFENEEYEFDKIIKSLVDTRLVIYKDKKIELLTSRLMIVHFEKGMFIGENRDGRVGSWMKRNYHSKTE